MITFETTVKLVIGFAMALSIAPLAIVAVNGQEMSETDKLSALLSELAQFGYVEVADLTYSGDLVEFRSNGTITIHEDQAGEIISKYGFSLIEFAPAPALEEDSIIIVSMNRGIVL